MGEVYLVEHRTLHAEFALKVLRPRFQAREDIVMRFRAESRALWELQHPNVVKVHHAGEDPEIGPFMAMEVLRGKNLAQVMYAVRALTIEQAVSMAIEVAETVEAMHQVGIIHRDLKPENIFITTKPREPRGVKLLDLGAAKIAKYNQPTTEHHKTIGTGKYMSPEHIRGTGLTNQSDIYALGHIVYELLAGRHAFGAHHPGNPNHWDYQVWHLNAQAEPLTEILPGFPMAMWLLIERAIRKEPSERFGSMQAFAEAMRRELRRHLGEGGTDSVQRPAPPSSISRVTLEEALDIPTPPGNWSSTLIAEALSSRSGALENAGASARRRTERVAGGQDEAPPLAVANLEIVEGKHAGKVFPLAVRSFVIGRDDECDIPLEEGSLSGKHARIEIQSAAIWLVHDLGSTNGVEVNGQGVRSTVLSPGQRFRLGRNIFRLTLVAPPHVPSERIESPLVGAPLATVRMTPGPIGGATSGVTSRSEFPAAKMGAPASRDAAPPTLQNGAPLLSQAPSGLTPQGTAISWTGSRPLVVSPSTCKSASTPLALVKTAPAQSSPRGSPLPFATPYRVPTAEMHPVGLADTVNTGLGQSTPMGPSGAAWGATPSDLSRAASIAPGRSSAASVDGGSNRIVALIVASIVLLLLLGATLMFVLSRIGLLHFG